MPTPRPATVAPPAAKWRVLAVIGILLGCALAVWWGLASSVGKPTWTVLSYHVVDSRTVDVTYVVSRPKGREVTCVIRAMDRGFGTVGLVQIRIPGSDESSVRRTTRVRTTTRAVTGTIRSCAIG